MHKLSKIAFVLIPAALAQSPQNPSPMVEHTRAHTRLTKSEPPGERVKLSLGTLYLPPGTAHEKRIPLLIHFHGASWLPEQCAHKHNRRMAVLSVNLGAGSAAYSRPFQDASTFPKLLDEAAGAARTTFRPVILSGFSAGYGAIREILQLDSNWTLIDAVLLIDGIHTSYDPEGKPGPLKAPGLEPFLKFARDAAAGHKRMLITHSEIFPGTFASTTECTDYLLDQLGLKRRPTVKWGPLGMQQLSEVKKGNFTLMGFAGNSAPDHIDQLHALTGWLRILK